tara:strand:- start:4126 stop:4380 length:255 start_codon:yes stop_codon:yes gene_type:complete
MTKNTTITKTDGWVEIETGADPQSDVYVACARSGSEWVISAGTPPADMDGYAFTGFKQEVIIPLGTSLYAKTAKNSAVVISVEV